MISFVKFLKIALPLVTAASATAVTTSLVSSKKIEDFVNDTFEVQKFTEFVNLDEHFEEKIITHSSDGSKEEVNADDFKKAEEAIENLKKEGTKDEMPFKSKEESIKFLNEFPEKALSELLKKSNLSDSDLSKLASDKSLQSGKLGKAIKDQSDQLQLNRDKYSPDLEKIESQSFNKEKEALDSESLGKNLSDDTHQINEKSPIVKEQDLNTGDLARTIPSSPEENKLSDLKTTNSELPTTLQEATKEQLTEESEVDLPDDREQIETENHFKRSEKERQIVSESLIQEDSAPFGGFTELDGSETTELNLPEQESHSDIDRNVLTEENENSDTLAKDIENPSVELTLGELQNLAGILLSTKERLNHLITKTLS